MNGGIYNGLGYDRSYRDQKLNRTNAGQETRGYGFDRPGAAIYIQMLKLEKWAGGHVADDEAD